MKPPFNIAIIGAGPAGLMAAEWLATAGCRVTIYDQMPTPARKLLIAGRGGLNLTHSEPLDIFLTRYGAAEKFLSPAIEAFPPAALRAWCEELGVETFIGSSGRVFPRSMKAVALLRAWLKRLEQLDVTYAPRHRWIGWENAALCFENAAGEKVTATPDATLLALGGASWPRLGSNGFWVKLLQQRGVNVAALRPSNCGFITPWSDYFVSRFAGQPLKPVAITHQGITRQGEAMITREGIEGGVIYAHSAAIREAITVQGKTEITLDLRPAMRAEQLTTKLATRGSKSLSSHLRSSGFSPLSIALLHETTPAAELSIMDAAALAARLKSLPVTLTATTGIDRAISSAGGIRLSALNADYMLRDLPGIFAAGEMLDWEAPTGGYLLQACFSSAVAAAEGMLRYCGKRKT